MFGSGHDFVGVPGLPYMILKGVNKTFGRTASKARDGAGDI